MKLSVIIPCLDDPDILNTVESIRLTSPANQVEIVVVNDAGLKDCRWPAVKKIPNVVVVDNRNRCGSGPCRQIGALWASGDWLLHTDAHMRFPLGWYDEFFSHARPDLNINDMTVFCATMIGSDKHGRAHGEYHGATMNFLGPDPNHPAIQQVFEANWLKHVPEDGAAIPVCMGACYFINREWYLWLAPHRCLRSWGKEEEMLSLKTWFSGGQVRLLKTVRLEHIFRGKDDRLPYEIPPADRLYNKLFVMRSLLPEPLADKLELKIEDGALGAAQLMLVRDWHLVAAEQASFAPAMSVEEYAKIFNIPLP